MIMSLVAEGCTFSMLAKAINMVVQTCHAQQRLQLYEALSQRTQHVGQGRFRYPELTSADTTVWPQYVIDTYRASIRPLLEAHQRLQGTFAHWVVKLDAGFKVGTLNHETTIIFPI